MSQPKQVLCMNSSCVLAIIAGALGIFLGWENPFVQTPAFVLALPLALWILSLLSTSKKQALLHGWMLGFLGFSAALYWLYYPIHEVGELPFFLAIPCILLVGSFLGLYTALACLVFLNLRILIMPLGHKHTHLCKSLFFAICCGLAFGGIELLTSRLLTGFPWFVLSAAFVPWPAFIQLAAIVGSFGLSAIYATSAVLLGLAMTSTGKNKLVLASCCIIIFGVSFAFGLHKLSLPPSNLEKFNVLMVQGNVDQNQKWDTKTLQTNVELYIRLSQEALDKANAKVDLIIWPETALPFAFDYNAELATFVHNFARENKISLAFGTVGAKPNPTPSPPFFYNRLQILNPDGKSAAFYDKEHLVPFGEYIPFAINFPFLQNILQGVDFYSGKSALPLKVVTNNQGTKIMGATVPNLGILICYEAIFPNLAQERVANGANLLLTISNDGWFGKSSAPFQHLAISSMRSVEQARPMLRATNTGITASIDKNGRIIHKGKLFVEETLLTSTSLESEKTVFHKAKFFIELILAASLFFSFIIPWLGARKEYK